MATCGHGHRNSRFLLRAGLAFYAGFQRQSHPADGETDRAQRNPAANPTILSGDLGVSGDPADNSFTVVEAVNVGSTAILEGVTILSGQTRWSEGGLLGI